MTDFTVKIHTAGQNLKVSIQLEEDWKGHIKAPFDKISPLIQTASVHLEITYSSVHIKESKVIHKTEVI